MNNFEKSRETSCRRNQIWRTGSLVIALAFAAMAVAPALAQLPQCPPLCVQPPIVWSNSFQYDIGMLPRVASLLDNQVIEVHQGGAGGAVPLWYRLGYPTNLNSLTQAKVNFLGSIQYDFGAAPSVGGIVDGGDAGDFRLIEVHQANVDVYVPLWSDQGITYRDGPATWLSLGEYDVGYAPAVAMDWSNDRVEVHQASWGFAELSYHLNGGPSIQYDYGSAPSVSISTNEVVEVHQGDNDSLWYRAGPISGSQIVFGPGVQYDSGYLPSVSIVGRTAVEVHQDTSSCPGPLSYRVGTVQGQQITWSSSIQYDFGCSPSVATDGYLVYEVHQAGPDVGPLWSRMGFLQ